MHTQQPRKMAGQASLGSKKAVALNIRQNTGSAEQRGDTLGTSQLVYVRVEG